MHHFKYRDNELLCEDVPVKAIAAAVGTPFYLYSHATIQRHFQQFDAAFASMDRLICYSAKANANLAILKTLSGMGSGLDIVSGGELYRGLRAGFPPDRIVYSGVGKRSDEIDYALETGIRMFNVESMDELSFINERAGALGKQAPVSIRVNPNVDPKTHPYISTGLKKNKFGIDAATALSAYRRAAAMAHVDVVGIDCHIGSQIVEIGPFVQALDSLKKLIGRLAGEGIFIRYLDMGGGLGITYNDEKPPALSAYAAGLAASLKGLAVTLILEPGRVIVGNAGVLITKTLYRKTGSEKDFVIVDAGMNDLLRPTLYSAFHAIWPVDQKTFGTIKGDVVGPICESGDFLAVDREMPAFQPGDLLAVMSAGAYGFVMSSNYCARLKTAEVMVRGGEFFVVKERQQYADLVAGEEIPYFLNE